MMTNSQDHDIQTMLMNKQFKDAEKLAVAMVSRDPLHAQGWVFLGEALMLQGYKETATRVFERAQLMDPEAAWSEAVFHFLEKLKPDIPRYDIEMLLEVEPVTVSAAMIVRNEERSLARCLEQLQHAVDEIVIVDTGSTDGTVEIAKRYSKVRLFHSPWTDDFAAARNVSLQHVTSDWVICVDADDYLFKADCERIRLVAALYHRSKNPAMLRVGRFHSWNGEQFVDYNECRMFPMHYGIQYKGKAHAYPSLPAGYAADEVYSGAVHIRFHHDGYEPEIVAEKDKLQTRLRQISVMLVEEPNNPIWWMFYGREIRLTGDDEKALEMLSKADQLAEHQPGFGRRQEIWMLLADLNMEKGELEQAREILMRALQQNPDFPDAHYKLARIELEQVKHCLQEAHDNLQRVLPRHAAYRGMIPADRNLEARTKHALQDWELLVKGHRRSR